MSDSEVFQGEEPALSAALVMIKLGKSSDARLQAELIKGQNVIPQAEIIAMSRADLLSQVCALRIQ
jgi:hypothetical protein